MFIISAGSQKETLPDNKRLIGSLNIYFFFFGRAFHWKLGHGDAGMKRTIASNDNSIKKKKIIVWTRHRFSLLTGSLIDGTKKKGEKLFLFWTIHLTSDRRCSSECAVREKNGQGLGRKKKQLITEEDSGMSITFVGAICAVNYSVADLGAADATRLSARTNKFQRRALWKKFDTWIC